MSTNQEMIFHVSTTTDGKKFTIILNDSFTNAKTIIVDEKQ